MAHDRKMSSLCFGLLPHGLEEFLAGVCCFFATDSDDRGALEEHDGKVFVPGVPRKPVCGVQVLRSLVSRGWLNSEAKNSRFEITEEGKRVEGEINSRH